jgi:hypothetical protein
VSKEEILEAIQKTAAELGRAPSMPELRDKTGISPRQVREIFYRIRARSKHAAWKEAEPDTRRRWMRCLKTGRNSRGNWAGCRKFRVRMYAKYSAKPLLTRFGTWGDVPAGLLFAAEQQGWEGGWEDVLEVARVHLRAAGKAVRRSRTANRTPNQPKI